jgi:uncharacterized repeat protein (TIGR03806 family)
MNKRSWIAAGLITTGMGIGWMACKNKDKEAAPTGFAFKEKLSQYGFFTGNLKDLQPVAGVMRYELVTPLFTDHALKDRFIVLPAGKTIGYRDSSVLDFPDSTILIKNFAYRDKQDRKILIETRLLVKDPQEKNWKVMDYLWDSTQSDATKHIIGAKIPLDMKDESGRIFSTVYQVPNTNDCKRCHISNGGLTPIGPKARNLNFAMSGHRTSQLEEWAKAGRIDGMPSISQVPALPDWKDSLHYSVEQRARAYLDVNCSHCHTQGGDAMNTGLFLEYQQHDPQHLGFMKTPVSAGGGAGGLNYDIIPGDAAHSILAYRMNSAEAGTAMPELGRTVIHHEAVSLVMQWINQLQPKQGNHIKL